MKVSQRFGVMNSEASQNFSEMNRLFLNLNLDKSDNKTHYSNFAQ